MREKMERFDAGRTFRRAITMEYLMVLLGPHKKGAPTEPIAKIHPVTGWKWYRTGAGGNQSAFDTYTHFDYHHGDHITRAGAKAGAAS